MSGKFDPIFGQSKVFSTEDSNVNPDVIAYLASVRNEALTTSAIAMSSVKQPDIDINIRHDASIYDDESEPVTKKTRGIPTDITTSQNEFPAELVNFNERMTPVVKWFEQLQTDVNSQPSNLGYHYDDLSLDILLFNIKQILETKNTQTENKGVSLHLMNILKDWAPQGNLPEGDEFEIDEEWIEKLLLKLECVKIPTIDFLKSFITGDYTYCEPRGFKAWNQFLVHNEPCKDMFATMINSNNIWLLVKYMAQTWITQISAKQSHNLTLWLLYILVYLPRSVVANNTSTLRDLGKKCRGIILEFYWEDKDKKNGEDAHINPLAILPHELKVEFKQFVCKPTPPETSLVELTLYIIATTYGQFDLLEWDHQ